MSYPLLQSQARMKNLRTFLWGGRRRPLTILREQLELDLPGSRLSRDEIRSLEALRRLRDRLAAPTSQ